RGFSPKSVSGISRPLQLDLAFCTLRSRQLTQSLDQISSLGYFTFLVKCLRLGQDLRSAIPNARHQAYSGHRIVEGVLRFDKRLAIAITWDEVRTQRKKGTDLFSLL
ncbi:hypothetical protein, partial [Pseudomonas aeruginosa]